MAKDGGATFEIPAQMRQLAEDSVEQAKQAFDSFISAARKAVDTAETQAASARSGAKEVGDLAMRFAARNIDTSFEFARKLARAKDGQEMLALHGEYVSGQIAALTDQAKELSRRAGRTPGQSTNP